MWLAVALCQFGQTLAEIFCRAEVTLRQRTVDQMGRKAELAAQTIPAARILASGNVESAPEHAVLRGQDRKVGQRVQLIAACAGTRRESGCDLVGPSLLAPPVA